MILVKCNEGKTIRKKTAHDYYFITDYIFKNVFLLQILSSYCKTIANPI
jgi:hypothetical protein